MPLPRVDVPLYDLKLPSSGQVIKYRPFLVKEKKLFLLVRESKDIKDIVNTIKQIIQNCIVNPVDINVDEMPIIDIEYLFVNLRARSVGEVVELEFECQNKVEDKPCGHHTKLKFNLLDVKIDKPTGLETNKVEFNNKIGVVMKYPTFSISQVLSTDSVEPQDMFDVIIDCIDYIYDEDHVHKAKDEKRDDLKAWFETIPQEYFDKIMKFFDDNPKIIGHSKFNCEKCGYEEEITLSGIQDFFG
jgi:hypothetical protein